MNSLNRSVWRCQYLCRRTKIRLFRALVLPVLLYGSETWSIGVHEQGRLNSFSTRALRRIMGFRWDNFVPNDRLLYETGIDHQVTCMIRQRQLQLFGHLARFPGSGNRDDLWRDQSYQGEATCDLFAGHRRELGLARRMHTSRRKPLDWRRPVVAANRHISVCFH